jgi:hypothetical protein
MLAYFYCIGEKDGIKSTLLEEYLHTLCFGAYFFGGVLVFWETFDIFWAWHTNFIHSYELIDPRVRTI